MLLHNIVCMFNLNCLQTLVEVVMVVYRLYTMTKRNVLHLIHYKDNGFVCGNAIYYMVLGIEINFMIFLHWYLSFKCFSTHNTFIFYYNIHFKMSSYIKSSDTLKCWYFIKAKQRAITVKTFEKLIQFMLTTYT